MSVKTKTAQARSGADQVEAALKPYALPSSYPNYFGTDRPDQAAQACGENAERLLRLKQHYDPHGMFEAISLPSDRPSQFS
jgi:FAD/FMN-containing dehydrogenase